MAAASTAAATSAGRSAPGCTGRASRAHHATSSDSSLTAGTAPAGAETAKRTSRWCSAPHGAGRQFSRTAARKHFTRDQLRQAMSGIEYRDTDAFLDEIPGAYKDIDQVMADSADLVSVRHTLRQLLNVKGD